MPDSACCWLSTADFPLGLLLAVHCLSTGVRCVVMWPRLYYLPCAVLDDFSVAMGFAIMAWFGGALVGRLLALVAALVLGLDLSWRMASGTRLHLASLVFLFEKLGGSNGNLSLSKLLSNLAMAPPATLWGLAMLAPVAWLLVKAAHVTVPATRVTVATVAAIFVLGAAARWLCGSCSSSGASTCSLSQLNARSANALLVVASDIWLQLLPASEMDREAAHLGSGLDKPDVSALNDRVAQLENSIERQQEQIDHQSEIDSRLEECGSGFCRPVVQANTRRRGIGRCTG